MDGGALLRPHRLHSCESAVCASKEIESARHSVRVSSARATEWVHADSVGCVFSSPYVVINEAFIVVLLEINLERRKLFGQEIL